MASSRPQMERPVMFMETKNGKLSISKEAAAILRAIDKPAVVVAIAGKYRTGKSYLMNRLFGGSAGFSLGSTVQSHTQGFWLWAKVHPSDPDKWLILIDVEGLADVEKGDTTYDTKLFSLTILLCSCLVYNSTGTIDNDAVQQLHFVTNLAEHIKMSAEGEEDGNDFDKFFPSFYWVVRDFTLKLEIDGKSCTEDEYLEHALKLKSGRGKAVEDFNRTREYIRCFFTERKCFAICKPIDDERIQSLETVSDHELRPQFLDSINKFCSTILKEVKAFKVGTTSINGPRLLCLAETYIKAINHGAAPCIYTAFELMKERECQKAISNAVSKYISEMDQILSKLPMDLKVLSEEHLTAQKIATVVYHNTAVFDAKGEYQEELQNIIMEKHQAYVERNERSSKEKCKQLLTEMYTPIHYKIQQGHYSGKGCYKDYKSDYDKMIEMYESNPNKGPCADGTLQKFLKYREPARLAILANDKAISEKEEKISEMEQRLKLEHWERQRADEQIKRLQQQVVDKHESVLVMMKTAKEEFDLKIQQMNQENEKAMLARETEWKRLMGEGLQRKADMHREAIEELQKEKQELTEAHRGRIAAMEESIKQQKKLIGEIRENPPKQEKGFFKKLFNRRSGFFSRSKNAKELPKKMF